MTSKQGPGGNTAGLLVGLVLALASAFIPNLDTGSQTETTGGESAVQAAIESPPPTVPELSDELGQLVEVAEGSREGYSRDAFKHWIDADADGCDTREEVLLEQSLTPATQGTGCAVSDGMWLSLYDEVTFNAPGSLDVDHVVPLAEAWDSGASQWDSLQRQEYANDLDDPEALLAVSASSNRSKSDQDPAEWKPPNVNYWCQYASDWIAVKLAWSLTVDALELAALEEMIATCESDPPDESVSP